MFNSLKSAFAVLLLAGMSTTAFAGIGGKVGVASDNYFRGHNICLLYTSPSPRD